MRLQRIDEGFRFQRSLAVEVENAEGLEVPVRWYYRVPMVLFSLIPLLAISIAFAFLLGGDYFDQLFDCSLTLYVKSVLGIESGLSVSPLLRLFFYGAVLFLLGISFSLIPYFIIYFIRKRFPNYYKAQSRKKLISASQSRKRKVQMAGILFLSGILIYVFSDMAFMLVLILVAVPAIFFIYFMQRILGFIGLRGELSDADSRLVRAAFKQWIFLGVVVCAGLCFSPVYMLTEKSLIVSIFNGMKEVNWSEVIDLELKVAQSSSGGSSSSGFDKYRYSVSANASSKPDLNLELFSLESKDTLNKIVDVFKNKGVPIKCKVDGSLDAVLGGVDFSKLSKSEKDQVEMLSYVNETCKKVRFSPSTV